MKRLYFLPIIFALTLSVGCIGKAKTKVNNAMASWEGHHLSELLSSWGPPQQFFDDGHGGRILVYTSERTWTTPGQTVSTTNLQVNQWNQMILGSGTSITTYNPSRTYGYTAWRMFSINRNGYIYGWSWRGL